jgi:hypothetical protein
VKDFSKVQEERYGSVAKRSCKVRRCLFSHQKYQQHKDIKEELEVLLRGCLEGREVCIEAGEKMLGWKDIYHTFAGSPWEGGRVPKEVRPCCV